MKLKTKLALVYPQVWLRIKLANRLFKRITKYQDEDRYPEAWKRDHIIKKGRGFLRNLAVDVKVEGWENVPYGAALLTPNHASALDATLICVALKTQDPSKQKPSHHPIFIAKEETRNDKRWKGLMGVLDTRFIDRNNPRSALRIMTDFIDTAKKQRKSAVIFPAGTRAKDGTVGDFKGGAFKMAKKGYLPIVPVTINNSPAGIDFERRGRATVTVIFHKPIKPNAFMHKDNKWIAKEVQDIVNSKFVPPVLSGGKNGEGKVG